MTSLLQWEINRIVVQLKETFDSRIRDLEITCRELTHSLEFQRSEFEDRLDQMESKFSAFEIEANRIRTETNLVVSGIPEQEEEQNSEQTKATVMNVLSSTLGLNEVKSEDIVDVRRLGKHRLESTGSCHILVRTKSKVVRDKIMSAKSKQATHAAKIFLKEDLTF